MDKASKNLTEMTLEELWQLFPIVLTAHDPDWAVWYAEEAAALKSVLPDAASFYHVGSTAVEGIRAKPIVDILVTFKTVAQMENASVAAQNNGYLLMAQSKERISLNKGYTPDGYAKRVFHLHLRLENDVDEVYFCKYLKAHPNVAKQYEDLKLRLWKEYEHDRDAYTEAKTDFVRQFTEISKQTVH